MPEAIDVVAAHLVDGDQHDQLRLALRPSRRGGPRRSARRGSARAGARGRTGNGVLHDRRRQSYNQRMPYRRQLRSRRVAIVALGSQARIPAAQAPSLNDVLKRTAAYVAAFTKQLSGIVAEETYRQDVANTARDLQHRAGAIRRQRLRSDLLLVKPVGRRSLRRAARRVRGRRQAGARSRRRGSRRCCAIRTAGDAQIARSSRRARGTTSAASSATSTRR